MAPGASPGKTIALLALAVSLACIALLVLFGRPGAAPGPEPRQPEPPAVSAEAEVEPLRQARPPVTAPRPAAPRAGASEDVEPPADPDAAEAAEALAEDALEEEGTAMVPSGIGLFPPPGTDPIKVGIVVPEDFELPEGFLRHHQVTDDGQELEPILLFHPDYELRDAAGRAIALPESRVVPPELAPPGLPVRMLEVPPPLEEAGP